MPHHLLLHYDSATLKITNSEEWEHGPNYPPQVLFLQPLTLQCPCTPDTSHYQQRWRHKIISLLIHIDIQRSLCHLTPTDITTAIWVYVTNLKIHHSGINPDLVSVHSLLVGGAMSLILHSEINTTIMKIGRWYRITFPIYINNQIGNISKGVSQKMSRPIPFLNLSAIKT